MSETAVQREIAEVIENYSLGNINREEAERQIREIIPRHIQITNISNASVIERLAKEAVAELSKIPMSLEDDASVSEGETSPPASQSRIAAVQTARSIEVSAPQTSSNRNRPARSSSRDAVGRGGIIDAKVQRALELFRSGTATISAVNAIIREEFGSGLGGRAINELRRLRSH